MRILLTGSNGYIGKRLLPVLLKMDHEVVCCVRDKNRFSLDVLDQGKVEVVEVDFLKAETLQNIPDNIDGAYYLIHSMSGNTRNFDELEAIAASNFRDRLEQTKVQHVIYLGGIVNDNHLSKHLRSRQMVENILEKGKYNFRSERWNNPWFGKCFL